MEDVLLECTQTTRFFPVFPVLMTVSTALVSENAPNVFSMISGCFRTSLSGVSPSADILKMLTIQLKDVLLDAQLVFLC